MFPNLNRKSLKFHFGQWCWFHDFGDPRGGGRSRGPAWLPVTPGAGAPGAGGGGAGGPVGGLEPDEIELGELYWIESKPPSDAPDKLCGWLEFPQEIAHGANSCACRLGLRAADEFFQAFRRAFRLRFTILPPNFIEEFSLLCASLPGLLLRSFKNSPIRRIEIRAPRLPRDTIRPSRHTRAAFARGAPPRLRILKPTHGHARVVVQDSPFRFQVALQCGVAITFCVFDHFLAAPKIPCQPGKRGAKPLLPPRSFLGKNVNSRA